MNDIIEHTGLKRHQIWKKIRERENELNLEDIGYGRY